MYVCVCECARSCVHALWGVSKEVLHPVSGIDHIRVNWEAGGGDGRMGMPLLVLWFQDRSVASSDFLTTACWCLIISCMSVCFLLTRKNQITVTFLKLLESFS